MTHLSVADDRKARLGITPAPSLHNTASGETRGAKTAITVSAFIFSN
jgi:hypothetical protein